MESFQPLAILDIDLADPVSVREISNPRAGRDSPARALVRYCGYPIGFVSAERASDLTVETIPDLLHPVAHSRLEQRRAAVDGPALPPRAALAACTVVLCTRERPERLSRALASILDAVNDRTRVLIVDNAPVTDATREVVAACSDPRVEYSVAPQVGLSAARNVGLSQTSGEFTAFTDDDVIVDPDWLRAIAAGFDQSPAVACVTGLVPSAEISTRPQLIFDSKIWIPRWDLKVWTEAEQTSDRVFPFNAGACGTGANFAVRNSWIDQIGPFDEALGAGAVTRGGEDLDYFFRIIRAGGQIGYEPRAIVWHFHRLDEDGLRQQLRAYGSGMTAFLAKQFATSPPERMRMLRLLPRFAYRAPGVVGETERAAIPFHLKLEHTRGLVEGPLLYLAARRRIRRISRRYRSKVRPASRHNSR